MKRIIISSIMALLFLSVGNLYADTQVYRSTLKWGSEIVWRGSQGGNYLFSGNGTLTGVSIDVATGEVVYATGATHTYELTTAITNSSGNFTSITATWKVKGGGATVYLSANNGTTYTKRVANGKAVTSGFGTGNQLKWKVELTSGARLQELRIAYSPQDGKGGDFSFGAGANINADGFVVGGTAGSSYESSEVNLANAPYNLTGPVQNLTLNWRAYGNVTLMFWFVDASDQTPIFAKNGIPYTISDASRRGRRLKWQASLAAGSILKEVIMEYADAVSARGFGYKEISGSRFRKSIAINNTGADFYNYPQRIIVNQTSGGDINGGGSILSNFNDVRFTAADGVTPLSYYLDPLINTATPGNYSAIFWVKIPQVQSAATTTIWMYYGNNAAAANLSDYRAVFGLDDPVDIIVGMNGSTTQTELNTYNNTNFGNGFTLSLDEHFLTSQGVDGLTAGDIDNDGDMDILLATNYSGGAPVYMRRNQGDGTFGVIENVVKTDGTNITVPQVNDLAMADIDLDGDNDLITYSSTAGSKIYKNDGTGVFVDDLPAIDPGSYIYAGTAADFNNDGYPDIIIKEGSSGSTRLMLYLNNPLSPGNFTFSTNIVSNYNHIGSVAGGDFDNDGDMDVVFADSTLDRVKFRRNTLMETGSLGFSYFKADGSTALPEFYFIQGTGTTERPLTAVASGDFNADGLIDFCSGYSFHSTDTDQEVKVFRNDGNFVFTEIYQIAQPDGVLRLFATDLRSKPSGAAVSLGLRGGQEQVRPAVFFNSTVLSTSGDLRLGNSSAGEYTSLSNNAFASNIYGVKASWVNNASVFKVAAAQSPIDADWTTLTQGSPYFPNSPVGLGGAYLHWKASLSGSDTLQQVSLDYYFGSISAVTVSPASSLPLGTNPTISWTRYGTVPSKNLYYSTNNGANWYPIASGITADSYNSWQIIPLGNDATNPGSKIDASKRIRFKVTDAQNEGVVYAASGEIDVDAGAAKKLAFTTKPASIKVGEGVVAANKFILQRQDDYGNATTLKADGTSGALTVNLTLPSGGTNNKFLNSSGATITSIDIISGSTDSPEFYYYDEKARNGITITASATGLTSTTTTIDIASGAATKLIFATKPTSIKVGDGVVAANKFIVQRQDRFSNATTLTAAGVSGSLTVSLPTPAGGLNNKFLNSSGGTITNITIADGATDSPDLYYYDEKINNALVITASATGLTSATTTITITPGAATKLIFTTKPTSIKVGEGVVAANKFIIQRQDNFSNPTTLKADGTSGAITVNLPLPSGRTNNKFLNSSGATITSIDITSGNTNAADLYYYDEKITGASPLTITASATDLTSATTTITITPGVAYQLAFTVKPTSIKAGEGVVAANKFTIQRQDSFANATKLKADGTSGALTVSLVLPSGGTNNKFLSGSGQQITIIDIPNDSESVDFYYYDEKARNGVTITASGAGLTTPAAAVTLSVRPAVAYEVVFTANPTSIRAGQGVVAANRFTVQRKDQFGNITSEGTLNINLTLPSGGTNNRYLNGSGGIIGPTNPLQILSGNSTVDFYYYDEKTHDVTITASGAGLVTPAISASLSVVPAAANKLAFTVNPTSVTAGQWTTKFTVQRRDPYDNPTTLRADGNSGALTVNLTSSSTGTNKKFAATSGGAAVTAIDIPVNSNNADFYYNDEKASAIIITASGAGLGTAASAGLTINPDGLNKLVFTEAPNLVTSGMWTRYTVQRQDQFNNLITATPLDVGLTSSSATGKFSSALSGIPEVTQITIANGQDSGSFYYRDGTAGDFTLTATAGSVSQSTAITVLSAGIFIISPNPTTPEVWVANGNSKTITWTSSGLDASPVRVLMSTDGGTVYNEISGDISSADGSHSFNWTVPNNMSGNDDVRFKIKSTRTNSPPESAPVRVRIRTRFNIVQPTAGSYIDVGSTPTITWTTPNGTTNSVRIELFNGSSWQDIVASTANSGSYTPATWIVPDAITANARIRISDAAAGHVNDPAQYEATNIRIRGVLSIDTPDTSGGEWVALESGRSISWHAIGSIGNIKISFAVPPYATWYQFLINIPSGGSGTTSKDTTFALTEVPDAVARAFNNLTTSNKLITDTRLRIEALSDANVNATSNAFQVKYYQVQWKVKDLDSLADLAGLTAAENRSGVATWLESGLNSAIGIYRNYAYGIHSTTWSGDPANYPTPATDEGWLADKDQLRTVYLESLQASYITYQAKVGYVYDPANKKVIFKTWLERKGALLEGRRNANGEEIALGGADLEIYDGTNAIGTLNASAGQHASGAYELIWDTSNLTLEPAKNYFVRVTVRYLGKSFVSGGTFNVSTAESVLQEIKAQTEGLKTTLEETIAPAVTTTIPQQITAAQGVIETKITEAAQATQAAVGETKAAVEEAKAAVTTAQTTIQQDIAGVKADTGKILVATESTIPSQITTAQQAIEQSVSTGTSQIQQVVTSTAQAITQKVGEVEQKIPDMAELKSEIANLSSQFSILQNAINKIEKDSGVAGAAGAGTGPASVEQTENMNAVYQQLQALSNQVRKLGLSKNKDVEKLLSVERVKSNDIVYLKNKAEQLKAMMEISQQLIDNVANTPVVHTWYEFEEGAKQK